MAYRGDGITVFDDRSICAHAGCCSDGLPQVFSTKRSPWIDASAAGVEELVRVIRQCPSGALAYALDGTDDQVTATGESGIQAWTDGPYVVRGGVSLVSADGTPYEAREPYSLCRCGASKNKPFCDGSHSDIGFTA